ncbi:unnamed protein product [Schistosoma mattheei]|uniref:Uncharacterized protein n=1 Tax=Schistosoma mattheei TaxID=31246 RepID=A0A183NV25_9TREM|nr:unnamed protein product [Schistosoma mattheei]
METSTSKGKHGIKWTAQNFALLSHTHEQRQMKTSNVAAVSESVGLNIHKWETKVLKYDRENTNQITFEGETLKDVESFTYLESIVDEQGGSDADVKVRVGKARAAFLQSKNKGIQNSYQPISKSEFLVRTSRQFYCTELKPEELQQPSSRRYKYL